MMSYSSTFWQTNEDEIEKLKIQFETWKVLVNTNVNNLLGSMKTGFNATSYQDQLTAVIFNEFSSDDKNLIDKKSSWHEWLNHYGEYQFIRTYLTRFNNTAIAPFINLLSTRQALLVSLTNETTATAETKKKLADNDAEILHAKQTKHSFFSAEDELNLSALLAKETSLRSWLKVNKPYASNQLPPPGSSIEMVDMASREERSAFAA
jgi:hypothetical protein